MVTDSPMNRQNFTVHTAKSTFRQTGIMINAHGFAALNMRKNIGDILRLKNRRSLVCEAFMKWSFMRKRVINCITGCDDYDD